MPDSTRETLISTWLNTVAAAPSARALVEADGRTWTRRELNDHSVTWAQGLPANLHRQRVAFALPNGPRWFATFLGLLHRQCTVVPLDAAEPPESQRELARAAGAVAWLVDDRIETLAPVMPRTRAPAQALIKLTSGSTGRPRILPFADARMLADGRQVCAGMGIRSDDLNLAIIPLGHSYGLGNLVMPLLVQGTALVCFGTPLPQAIAADVARFKPTVFPLVPALLRALTESDIDAGAFAPIRTIISAGAPLSAEAALAFRKKFNLTPHGFYGSSETGGISYDRTGEATLSGRSVGTPLPDVRIVPLRGNRIRVISPAVVRATGFSPADRAELTATGELRLLGRSGRLVKIAGRRVDLSEIEAAFRRLPGIDDAHVIVHPQHPEHLAAALATRLSTLELRPLLRERFASWKIPRRIQTVHTFPLTARGKTDTRALVALLSQ
jgi:long-chain acyl-CoA synthetase